MRKLLIVLFSSFFILCVSASDYGCIYDNADLFSDYEESLIFDAAEKVYTDSGLLTVVITDYGIGDVLRNLYDYAGDATDMAMFTIDMSAREFEIYQYNSEVGEAAFRISYDESEHILDSVFDDMASGNYADAAIMFVEMAHSAYVNTENFVSGDYDGYEYIEYDSEDVLLGMFLMSLLAGVVIGGISVLVVWLSYKKKVRGSTYPLSQFSKLNLTDSKDNFITKNVVVTHIPDPPSSSGGGGGGSRGGGGGGARIGGRSF